MRRIEDGVVVPATSEGSTRSFDRGASVRGVRIDRYVLLERLGLDTTGARYRAYDPDRRCEVALELVAAERVAGDPDAVRRGAQAVARIAHPHVLPIHVVGSIEGRVFVVTDLVCTRTLDAWLDEVQPTWRRIVEAFLGVARGLAAAHAAGVTHLDFKPQAVLVDDDGWPRVAGFSLLGGDAEITGGDETTTGDSRPEGKTFETTPIDPGITGGDPRYLSPEQHCGWPGDARSDQFSFCVAMYEALYRVRPFGRGGWQRVARRKLQRDLERPPARSPVPARIHRALLKGMHPDPDRRWPSMQALSSELSAGIGRRRRAWVAAGIGVLSLVGLASAVPDAATSHACDRAAAALETVWTDAHAQRIRHDVLRTGVAHAEETWARLQTRIDAYATRWAAAREQVCEATHVRGEQSLDMHDRRVACLDERLVELDTVLTVLRTGDSDGLSRAVPAVDALRSIDDCNDTAILMATSRTRDAAVAQRIAAIRTELARARGLREAGRPREAERLLMPLRTRSREVGDRALEADVLVELAEASAAIGDGHLARAWAVEGLHAAVAAPSHRIALRAAVDLVRLDGHLLGRFDDAHQWARLADALMEPHGEQPAMRAKLLHAQGLAFAMQGELERAKLMFDRALELRARIDPNAVDLGTMAAEAAEALTRQGDHDGARTYLRSAAEHQRRQLGPRHPATRRSETVLARARPAIDG